MQSGCHWQKKCSRREQYDWERHNCLQSWPIRNAMRLLGHCDVTSRHARFDAQLWRSDVESVGRSDGDDVEQLAVFKCKSPRFSYIWLGQPPSPVFKRLN